MNPPLDATTAPSNLQQLGRRALSLGAVTAFDYAVQFLLPIVLVRCLDPVAFGEYRLLWLIVGTVMAMVTLAVPASLYYYLPRSEAATKRLYINQTLLVHVVVGLVAAWAVSGWNPWLPQKLQLSISSQAIVPAFVLLWVIASVLDILPIVEERVGWQAKSTISLAAIRAITLSLAAVLWRELTPVLVALLAFVMLRVSLLIWYIAAHHGLRGPILRIPAFADQLKMAIPFWASAALYGLRGQADQWVAATLFSLSTFAAFSIAGVLGPVVNLFRHSVNYVFLPTMSRLEAAGDMSRMLELNSRANVMVGSLIFPLFALAFVFAENIVTVVYTDTYVEAAPVMRLYIVGLLALVVELASVTLLLRQGPFVAWINLVTLAVSVALNWYGAHVFGLVGAAAGTVIAMYIDRIATVHRIAKCTGLPLRQLQDWRGLGLLLLAAIVSAALTWGVVEQYFATIGALPQLVVGGFVLATTYALLATLFGRGREWLIVLRGSLE